VVEILSLAFMCIEAANTLIMGQSQCTALAVSTMPDQELLPSCWHPLSGDGSNIVCSIFAHKGCWHYDYWLKPFHSCWIIRDATQNIVDPPLKCIFGDGGDIVTTIFAHRRSRYSDYGLMPMHSSWGVHDARLKIGDTELTLIVKRW